MGGGGWREEGGLVCVGERGRGLVCVGGERKGAYVCRGES